MNIKKKRMLEALKKTRGIVTEAVKLVKTGRTVHYNWLKEDSEYAKAVQEIEDEELDFVENAFFKNIEKGDTAAQIFYLKTKGKRRGYSENQQNGSVVIKIEDERADPD